MSITLQFWHEVAGVRTDVTSAVLSDPTTTYGVKRDDTDAVVVADGTAMTRTAAGTYSHEFDPPAADLTYTYYVEWVYGGETTHTPFTYVDATRIVTVAEAKSDLRYSAADKDTYIEWLIDAATELVETHQTRKTLNATCTETLDDWPAGGTILLPWGPLVSVTSIVYVDADGVNQTWAAAEYNVDITGFLGRIEEAYNCSFPTLRTQQAAVTITYTAGHGAAATDVPALVRHAVRMLVYKWFNEPVAMTGSVPGLPPEVVQMLGYDRKINV